MQRHLLLFSDLQKRLSYSPIKTWRLLKRFRDDLRMTEGEDWEMRDRKLYVDVQRFIVELEQLGYEQVKSPDITDPDVKSDEIKKLVEEVKLISAEITESRIQEEMTSPEITPDDVKPNAVPEMPKVKSNEITTKDTGADVISLDIIASKDEVIAILKENVASKEQDIAHLRGVVETLAKQGEILTRQNAWLTNLIAAPKERQKTVPSDDGTDEPAAEAAGLAADAEVREQAGEEPDDTPIS